jgi:hypothetical protein
MRVFLVAHDERRRSGVVRAGNGQNYAQRKFLGTLMRYFFLGAATRLSLREGETAVTRPLISLHGRGALFATRARAAILRAVAIAAVAATAQVERHAAASTQDQSKRFHGQAPEENWTNDLTHATDGPSATGVFRST